MKQSIRYFSIGLLTASSIILILIYFIGFQDKDPVKPSLEELTAAVEDEGHYVINESEYISLSVNKEQVSEAPADKPEEETEEEPEEDVSDDTGESEIKTYTLKVEPNMLGPTISQLLADNGIIDDADAFSQYLEKKNYAPYIQLGEHELTSNMNHFEIAEEIAK